MPYSLNQQVRLYGSFTAVVTTSLSAAITDRAATSAVVVSAAGFPATGPYEIVVDAEHLNVTAGQGTTTWTVSRAYAGTQQATHAANAAVIMPAGAATDPTAVTVTVTDPKGVVTTPAAVKDFVGNYHVNVTPTVSGTWSYLFTGTGAVIAAGQGQFYVEANLP